MLFKMVPIHPVILYLSSYVFIFCKSTLINIEKVIEVMKIPERFTHLW